MRGFARTLTTCLITLTPWVAGSAEARDAAVLAEIEELESDYGDRLEIVHEDGMKHIPQSWRGGGINAEIKHISDAELRRFPTLLRQALSCYPKKVIEKNLRRVVLLESIKLYGTEYGTVYSRDAVFLSSQGIDEGYTNTYLTKSFHQTFSSILLANYRFPTTRWNKVNPPEFEYGDGGLAAIQEGRDGTSGKPEFYRDGFLNEYSKSELEEDFNTFSGLAFTKPHRLKSLVAEYPRISQKFDLWLEFYVSIDPAFTRARVLDHQPPGAKIHKPAPRKPAKPRDPKVVAEFRALEKEWDGALKFVYDNGIDHIPEDWQEEGIDANVTDISDEELRRFPSLLREALERYPEAVIKKNLRTVVLFESIEFFGLGYGATYSDDTVFLSSEGKAEGFSDTYLIKGFHHEFSSILFHNYKFPKERWEKVNPPGFEYSGSGAAAIRSGETDMVGGPKYYRDGLLTEYAKSALEEDFNVFSETVIYEPKRVKRLILVYPRLAKKFDIWAEFYQSIDPSFTRENILNGASEKARKKPAA